MSTARPPEQGPAQLFSNLGAARAEGLVARGRNGRALGGGKIRRRHRFLRQEGRELHGTCGTAGSTAGLQSSIERAHT